MTDSLHASLSANRLTWWPDLGIGYYPVTAAPYDGAYWDKYRALDRTPAGDKLTACRLGLVKRFVAGDCQNVVDVGIGGGRFVEDLGCHGFDVNPWAVDWLGKHGRFRDPWGQAVDAVTFWDSLEHIHDPRPLLANVRQWVFVSLPIFEGPAHVKRSKHFRTDEHCLYFTRPGLMRFMGEAGFELVLSNSMEQSAGREDIGTFVFRRIE